MAGRSGSRTTSVYRLNTPASNDIAECIQDKYLSKGFTVQDVTVGNIQSKLVVGSLDTSRAKWADHAAALTGSPVSASNSNSAGVLLVPLRGYAYAATWGMGHLIIAPDLIDPGFGFRFLIRRARPEQVRSITSHTLDSIPRTARTTIPGGFDVSAFGLEDFGQLVSRIVGPVRADDLSGSKTASGTRLVTARGADGLSVPMSKSSYKFIDDLAVLHNTVENDNPVAGLEMFEHTERLRRGDPKIDELDKLLDASLSGVVNGKLALSWPWEREDEHGEAAMYRIIGPGVDMNVDELQLANLTELVKAKPKGTRLRTLHDVKVQALSLDEEPIGRQIRADKWMTYETTHSGTLYVFHQGNWYSIAQDYVKTLRQRVEELFKSEYARTLPMWYRKKNSKGRVGLVPEKEYNADTADADSYFVCLDRKGVKSDQHPRGFESCDLLGDDDEFIHVKNLTASTAASHLFNQAIVSAEAFRAEVSARSNFIATVRKINTARADKLSLSFEPKSVVLAFGGKKAVASDLFTFSQITLLRCAQRLAYIGIPLQFASIADGPVRPGS